jgi:tRNA 2-thiouridine synthesizing protein A
MAEDVHISTMGMNCPKPLIETRKALKKMEPGQILIVEGDHQISIDEIPKAMENTGDEVLSVDKDGSTWVMKIKKA